MPGYTKRAYKGNAAATSLTASMSNVATSCTIAAYTGWPYGSDPFYVVVDPGTASEEKVLVTRTGATDTTLNVVSGGRGADDTSAQSHDSGATIYPVFTAVDAAEANTVASTLTTKGDILVHTGSVHAARSVGTNGHALVADSTEATGMKWAAVGDVTLTGSQTLTNKTLTSPTINTATVAGGTVTTAVVDQLEENWNISATAATGTINFNVKTASIWYYTSNASANHTLNIRGDASTTLSSMLEVGDSITVVWAVTNGTTPYWPSTFQVDGSTITPKWQGGAAPTAGNASSIDVYTYTILKTAATPTYTVLASRSQFK